MKNLRKAYLDSDIVLLGTGVAPLVAASYLLTQGKTVLLLNPDWDFFLEDSELSLDPFLQGKLNGQRLVKNLPEKALEALRPDFPGPIEFWSAHSKSNGYYDPAAPHIRQRGRLWISCDETDSSWNWETLENLYVEASDHGLNPQIFDRLPAIRLFPGLTSQTRNLRGLFIPKLYDADTVRYRNGILEFIRERLGPERVICAVNHIESMPDGIRFRSKGNPNTSRIELGMLIFWTPRLSTWILNQAKKKEISPLLPRGIRLWEQWSIVTRDIPNPSVVSLFGETCIWSEFEGPPDQSSRLAVMRAGPVISMNEIQRPQGGSSWASADSFSSLSSLFHELLKWDHLTLRTLKARALFEWEDHSPWLLSEDHPRIQVIPGCDGPLVDVIRTARSACENLLSNLG